MLLITIKYPFGPVTKLSVSKEIATHYENVKIFGSWESSQTLLETKQAEYGPLRAYCLFKRFLFTHAFANHAHIYLAARFIFSSIDELARWAPYRHRTSDQNVPIFEVCDAFYDCVFANVVKPLLHDVKFYERARKRKEIFSSMLGFLHNPNVYSDPSLSNPVLFHLIFNGGSTRTNHVNTIGHYVRNGYQFYVTLPLLEPEGHEMTTTIQGPPKEYDVANLPVIHVNSYTSRTDPWFPLWEKDPCGMHPIRYIEDQPFAPEVAALVTHLYTTPVRYGRPGRYGRPAIAISGQKRRDNQSSVFTNMQTIACFPKLIHVEVFLHHPTEISELFAQLQKSCPILSFLSITLYPGQIKFEKKDDDDDDENEIVKKEDIPTWESVKDLKLYGCHLSLFGNEIRLPNLDRFYFEAYTDGSLEPRDVPPFVLTCKEIELYCGSRYSCREIARHFAKHAQKLETLTLLDEYKHRHDMPQKSDFVSPFMLRFASKRMAFFDYTEDVLDVALLCLGYRFRRANPKKPYHISYVALLPGLILAAYGKKCKPKNDMQFRLRGRKRQVNNHAGAPTVGNYRQELTRIIVPSSSAKKRHG